MASIVKRGNRYCVVYTYTNDKGEKKQKWESFESKADAKKRKTEVEYKKEIGVFIVPQCHTLNELLDEYIAMYGKTKWALSTYTSNTSLIRNYVRPMIGKMNLADFTPRFMERYYAELLKTPAVPRLNYGKKRRSKTVTYVTPNTVREIHKLMRNCFAQAVKWELMEKNPCVNATVPKAEQKSRKIWDADTLFHAVEVCEDERLKLAINLSFACTLRMGEVLGLTWDCVDITSESIAAGMPCIQVTKELQRISKKALEALDKKDVLLEFPSYQPGTSTVLVLKKPKTASSVRRVYLPVSVAKMLVEWKENQDKIKEKLGSEYRDYGLVFASGGGMPLENSTINAALRRLIEENDLPPVVFHSLRHSSITYKLKLNGGDIKSVQGDSGHAQAKMVTDQYSHILDADRRHNASLFEKEFYSGANDVVSWQDKESASAEKDAGDETAENEAILMKLLKDPNMAALLKALAKQL